MTDAGEADAGEADASEADASEADASEADAGEADAGEAVRTPCPKANYFSLFALRAINLEGFI